MMHNARRMMAILAAVAFSMMMGGCLSKEEDGSASGFTGAPPDTQNSAPTISGNPQTAINIGDNYTFTPSANDADGDPLTFTVANLPSWARFNASSGSISGQPSLADVGTYSNITVSVSDGSRSTSLRSFEITVSQVALGSMTLSWTPPTENTDGSSLTNLAGYRIYFGVSQGYYPNRVDIDTAGISTYVVENLVPNTYYVVATSVNASGVESAYSNVAIKVVSGT